MRQADREARDAKVLVAYREGRTLASIGERFLLTEAGVRAILRLHGVQGRRPRQTTER